MRISIVLLSVILLGLTPRPAYALFGGEKEKILKEADASFDKVTKYIAENRMLDAISSSQESTTGYRKLSREYPNYKMQHVATRLKESSGRIAYISSKITAGEITVPPPEEIVRGAGKGYVSEPTESTATQQKDTPLPGFQAQQSTLIPKPSSSTLPSPSQKSGSTTLERTPPKPVAFEPLEEIDYVQRLKEADSDAARVRIITAMVEGGNATDAVLALEDLLEEAPYSQSLSLKQMHIQALMACNNYRHAETKINELIHQYPKDPAVRCLSAAINVSQGDYVAAMLKLDLLTQEFPNYADLYINLAYTSFIISPYDNRDDAIAYYKEGISRGARRDPGFETELRLEVKR